MSYFPELEICSVRLCGVFLVDTGEKICRIQLEGAARARSVVGILRKTGSRKDLRMTSLAIFNDFINNSKCNI